MRRLTTRIYPSEKAYIKVGNVIFHSALKTGTQFETNIFLSEDGEKYDTITIINPSIGVEIPLRDNRVSLDYDFSYNRFDRYSKQSHIDHRIRALGELKLTDYKISFDEIYRHFTDRSGSENVARLKQATNNFRMGLAVEFDQLAFDAGYTNVIQKYYSDDFIYGNLSYKDKNSISHILDLVASYRFLPKTSVLLENNLGFINYDGDLNPDSVYDEILIGLKGDLHKNLAINLKGGLRYQSYDGSTEVVDDSFTGLVIRGGLAYSITEDDKLSLNLERGVYESTYRNMNYYTVNSIGFNYTHLFNNKLSARWFGSYQLTLYPSESTEGNITAKRRDSLYGTGFGFTYNIRKWLTAEANYEYKQRESKFSTFDYSNQLTTIKLTAVF